MLLGDVITALDDEVVASEVLVLCGDLGLMASVAQAASSRGETKGRYAQAAVRRFADGADEEDWFALLNAVGRDPEPASAALVTMLRWALSNEPSAAADLTCGCGGSCR
ncbi:hypothetical protein SLNSH_06400 [Alsobacter soli]|uniref:Uncharacterized protein n=1 Tax=Alsobacter soli TaxID=2109933 RepID=A0A2T1HWE7_9HYPH|nr:hypothetical protein [Alsobacter soli]PSC06001.1 hypothetical protein SLNSH_06400 [Alsobacter soli]